eukprot:UN05439
MTVTSYRKREPKQVTLGCTMPLKYVPDRTEIFNIEIQPGQGGKLARAAGASAILLNKNQTRQGYAHIKLPSKETRLIPLECADR